MSRIDLTTYDTHAQSDDAMTILDEDFNLSLPYAPAGERAAVAAFYALAFELRNIPAKVKEAPIGEIRLQWWRDALGAAAGGNPPAGHPVLQALARENVLSAGVMTALDEAMDARAMFLYADEINSPSALLDHFQRAEAWLTAALLSLSRGAVSDSVQRGCAMLAGAYAGARWGRALCERAGGAIAAGDLVAEISARRTEAKNILNGPVAADVAGRLVFLSLTDAYARRDDGATFPVVKRLILFRSMVTGRLD